jgi:acetoin utilization deacetylase AcuC-like enzyme
VKTNVGFVTNPNHVLHAAEGHVEAPERLEAVLALLRECDLRDRLARIEPRDADDAELAWVHRQQYIDLLRKTCARGGGWFDPDTYCGPHSCDAAVSAAGACLAATEAVLRPSTNSGQRLRSAFCAVRPPGHHARPAQAMGFCLLNNVALAAQYARKRHELERVVIVDIDVHHGNGTQDAFYADPGVLYVSTHQYPFYPGTGRADETGAGEARGTNVNIPLPAGCGDEEYRAVFEQIVEPVVRRYRPQLLLVSCGFDAHFADPIAMMSLSVDGYGELTTRLRALADDLCDGRIVAVLEGGYDLTAVAWGARRAIEVLLGDAPTPDPLGPAPERRAPEIGGLLAEVRRLHSLR